MKKQIVTLIFSTLIFSLPFIGATQNLQTKKDTQNSLIQKIVTPTTVGLFTGSLCAAAEHQLAIKYHNTYLLLPVTWFGEHCLRKVIIPEEPEQPVNPSDKTDDDTKGYKCYIKIRFPNRPSSTASWAGYLVTHIALLIAMPSYPK